MKFRLIFSALAIIVAIGAYALKNSSTTQSEAPQAAQTQQAAPAAPQDTSSGSMSNFSINNRN